MIEETKNVMVELAQAMAVLRPFLEDNAYVRKHVLIDYNGNDSVFLPRFTALQDAASDILASEGVSFEVENRDGLPDIFINGVCEAMYKLFLFFHEDPSIRGVILARYRGGTDGVTFLAEFDSVRRALWQGYQRMFRQ